MTHRSPVRPRPRPRPTGAATPRTGAFPSATLATPAPTGDGVTTWLERAAQQILAVTYWFDPAPPPGSGPGPYPVTVRFSGRRTGVKGHLHPSDRFVHDETIAAVVPGSGPISLTVKVRGIKPGAWVVTAGLLKPTYSVRGPREREHGSGNAPPAAGRSGPVVQLWHRWAPSVGPSERSAAPVRTCRLPFARVPGILPGIWGALVTFGIIVALVFQSLVLAHDQLAVGPALGVTLGAIAVGILGAKGWFIVLHRHEQGFHRFEGWCIQGFITGATVAAALLLARRKAPAGVVLDATAPGLLLAMAVGRVGCFFAGCCGGPPTASRWGVWSSDQRVGARRIPTQLLESLLALSLGLGTLVVVLARGPAGGALFAAGLAAYTLGRQCILYLRAERRQTRLGGLVTAALAALVLVASVLVVVLLAR